MKVQVRLEDSSCHRVTTCALLAIGLATAVLDTGTVLATAVPAPPTPLTATVSRAESQPDPTNSPELRFSVTFSGAVLAFTAADVSVMEDGFADASAILDSLVVGATADPLVFAVRATVSPTGQYGTLLLWIEAGAVEPADPSRSPNLRSNTASIAFDFLAPAVILDNPAPVAHASSGASGAVVTFNAFGDNFTNEPTCDFCYVKIPAVCTPPSGSFFPIGVMTVSCTSTDPAGNVGHGRLVVTVLPAAAPPPAPSTTIPSLPSSGGRAAPTLELALALLTAGLCLVRIARRTSPVSACVPQRDRPARG